MKPWYMSSLAEVESYFDVKPVLGLNDQNVLDRLKRFGPNTDSSLNDGLDRIYKVWVKRNGQRKRVSVKYILPGDIVFLEPGCRVPADIRLVEVSKLLIEESMLTGNFLTVAKNTYAMHQETQLAEQKCMAFAGTFVVSGFGYGVVVAHANHTERGKLPVNKTSKVKKLPRAVANRLKNNGIIVNDVSAAGQLKKIDMVFIDFCMTNREVADIIRKVQLSKNLPCKFIVSESKAKLLRAELPGAVCLNPKDLAGVSQIEAEAKINEAQFIVDPSSEDTLKIVAAMQSGGDVVMWVTDGRQPVLAIKAANISLALSDLARDDVIYHADLIFNRGKIGHLPRILYNTN